jgi:uncharacterized protein (UPF0276 family)
LLLDVNNVFVSATNHDHDANAYLDAFPIAAVGEIHLAGCSLDATSGRALLIDDHGSAVGEAVWALYERALARSGPLPTLIEWDNDVPAWPELFAQATQAQCVLDRHVASTSSAEPANAAVG